MYVQVLHVWVGMSLLSECVVPNARQNHVKKTVIPYLRKRAHSTARIIAAPSVLTRASDAVESATTDSLQRAECVVCMYCIYLQVLHVWAGMPISAGIACICSYCIYVQVLPYEQVLHVSAGIACLCRYDPMWRYCMYKQVFHVCEGMSLCAGIACMCRYS